MALLARISACASRHQYFLTLCQTSAAHRIFRLELSNTADTAMDGQNPLGGRPREDFPYTFFGDVFRIEGQDLLFRCRVQRNGPQRR